MASKEDLSGWIVEAIEDNGGRAHLIQVAKHIWEHHERELRESGRLFYTWQYDMRWEAKKLRDDGILLPDSRTSQGEWALRE